MPNSNMRIQLTNGTTLRREALQLNHRLLASDIFLKHQALGGDAGFLGAAIGNENAIVGGRKRDYAHGSIYWSPATGAFEVHGLIREKYRQMGAERSLLGFPTTDETAGDGRGRFNHFQGGSIYWSPETGAFEIHGDIRRFYFDRGAERFLGYPVSDELSGPGNRFRFSNFQRGQIAWSPQTGSHLAAWTGPQAGVVPGGIRPQNVGGFGGEVEVRRRIQCHATMHIKDEENFGSDEFATFAAENEAILTSRHPTELMRMSRSMGGEIRVELNLTGQVLPGGDVRVTCNAKLFEGTSEGTSDLDGEENLTFLVPRDDTVGPSFVVRNTAEGDDDRADILINLTNVPA